MNKKVSLLIILSFLLIIVIGGAYSYSKYNTEVSGSANAKVSKWNITVNNCNIVNPDKTNTDCFMETVDADNNIVTINKNFNFGTGDFTYTNNNNNDVVDYKIAPGSSGTFKITIKPNDTQVSIKYKINVSLKKANSSILLYRSDPNETNKVLMENDGYEGVLQYNDTGFTFLDNNGVIKNGDIVEFIIYVDWINDEDNNDIDTEIGTSGTSPILEIPVEIVFEQYLG